MPRKTIIVNSCAACPYKMWDGNKQRVCRYSDNRIIDVAITTIPDWCELENYVETKEKINKG